MEGNFELICLMFVLFLFDCFVWTKKKPKNWDRLPREWILKSWRFYRVLNPILTFFGTLLFCFMFNDSGRKDWYVVAIPLAIAFSVWVFLSYTAKIKYWGKRLDD